MEQGLFQGQVLSELKTLGREIGDLKSEVETNRTAITDLRVALASRNGNGMKRKLGLAAIFVAAGGGLGFLLAALIRGLRST